MRSFSSFLYHLIIFLFQCSLSQQVGFVVDQSCNVAGKAQAVNEALPEALAMAENAVDSWHDDTDRIVGLSVAMLGAADMTNSAAASKLKPASRFDIPIRWGTHC